MIRLLPRRSGLILEFMRRLDHWLAPSQTRPDAVRAPELLLALVACLAVAIAFTWPLLLHLGDAIPAGGEAPTVALLNLTVVEHLGAVLRGEAGLWELGIFAPHAGTWAWSEPQPLSGLLHAGLCGLGLSSTAAYDGILLAFITGGGAVCWLAARQLTEDRVAVFAAAAWTTAGAFVAQRAAALHLVATVFPLLALWSVVGQAGGFDRRRLWLGSAALIATWLTCAQYLVLLVPLLVVAAAIAMPWRRLRPRQFAELVAATLPVVAVVLPSALVWQGKLADMGFTRPPASIIGVAHPAMLLRPAVGHWMAPATEPLAGAGVGALSWDVGAVLLAMGLVALVAARGRLRELYPAGLRAPLAWAAVAGLATALALTPHLRMGSFEPWQALCQVIPGLGAVRTPARLTLFAAFALAVLVAPALAWLRQHKPGARLPITVSCLALLAAEMWTMPVALVNPEQGVSDHGEVLGWLAARDDGRSVLELPMTAGVATTELERETRAMRRARVHHHPLVNGYSGYLPEPFWQLVDALERDPGGRGRRYLEALGVGWVILHEHDLRGAGLRAIRPALRGDPALRSGSDAIFELPPPGPNRGLPPLLDLTGPAAPQPGQILAVPLFSANPNALLLGPRELPRVTLSWPGQGGDAVTHGVILKGTALLDRGEKFLPIRLLTVPTGAAPGLAVLASRELAQGELGP